MAVVTRFAPSPTGDLHLGHAYAAAFARSLAWPAGGRFLVRIEDIDRARCREAFVERNLGDLRWLGLDWLDDPPVRQSARLPLYRAALGRLDELGVTYPCFCSRKTIRAEIEAAAGAPQAAADDGALAYPGTCRTLEPQRRAARFGRGEPYAVRLDVAAAGRITGPLHWLDRGRGPQTVPFVDLGDPVIARKDAATSYHLCVVVDDAAQGVTLVTRGEDLLPATHLHRLLYALLDLPVPDWWHHRLCRNAAGRRLAKRDGDSTIRALRAQGLGPDEVLALAGVETAIGDGAPVHPLSDPV